MYIHTYIHINAKYIKMPIGCKILIGNGPIVPAATDVCVAEIKVCVC